MKKQSESVLEKLSVKEIALLGTMLAIEITNCKTTDEIKIIKQIVSQMLATINTLLSKS